MIGQHTQEVERKIIAILKILNGSPRPLDGRVLARHLGDLSIDLGERAVREGSEKILANFWEIPAIARSNAEAVIKDLEVVDIKSLAMLGRNYSE